MLPLLLCPLLFTTPAPLTQTNNIHTIEAHVPAGTYEITAYSYDPEHAPGVRVDQIDESWSAPGLYPKTPDLPEADKNATWPTITVTLDAPLDEIVFLHEGTSGTADSVTPTLQLDCAPTPVTIPETTTPTTIPPPTIESTTSTVPETTSTTAATTTTVPDTTTTTTQPEITTTTEELPRTGLTGTLTAVGALALSLGALLVAVSKRARTIS